MADGLTREALEQLARELRAQVEREIREANMRIAHLNGRLATVEDLLKVFAEES
jgi:hypothetical protein